MDGVFRRNCLRKQLFQMRSCRNVRTASGAVFFSRRANRLVIFSDIDGLYDSDPRLHSEARLLSRIECIDDGVYAMARGAAGAG